MASRTNLPLMILGVLGGVTTSIGVGWGLGQYTVSGINPFYVGQGKSAYRFASLAQADPLPELYDPSARTD